MNDYALDFMSPDPDYLVAASFYRDEIDFLVNITGGGSYHVSMQTLMRVQQNIQARIGKIDDYVSAECERGLILVEHLDMDSLNNAIQLALSQNFFQQQRTINDLPLGIYGSTNPEDKRQYKDFYVTKKIKANRARHLELGSPRITQAAVQPAYLGHPVEYMAVTVEFGDGTQYVLTLISPKSVEAYFCLNAPTLYLTIPGLVIVKDLTTANLEDVIRWCHRQYYFETLQPCDCLSRQKPAATL